jgi:hypothetical protein
MNFTTSTASVSSLLTIGGYTGGITFQWQGTVQEHIIWHKPLGDERLNIEPSVADYYGISFNTPLLDSFSGAGAAYSVRKLRTAYSGNCMRIREDSGNTETDIGFDGKGDLDTAAIASHCGSANGYVVTWFDQVGAGSVNVTQGTAGAYQPKIYDGSAVLSDNGKPCVEFDGIDDVLSTPNIAFSGTSQSMFVVNNADASSGTPFRAMVSIGPAGGYKMRNLTHGPDIQLEVINNSITWPGSPGSQNLIELIPDGGATTILDYDLYQNGSLLTPTNTIQTQNLQSCAGGLIKLGYNWPTTPGSSQYHFDGKLQEVILYNNDQSSNRTGIESNINAYFSIYDEVEVVDNSSYDWLSSDISTIQNGVSGPIQISELIVYETNKSSNRTSIESDINDYFNILGGE